MSSNMQPTDLNNTPNVLEQMPADAPEALKAHAHRRGCPTCASGVVREWWWIRISAALLVPLSVWLVVSLISKLLGANAFSLGTWLGSTPVAIAVVATLALSFVHTRLGLHEIIIDYVHARGMKRAMNLFVDLLSLGLALASIAAVIRLHGMA